MHFSTLNSVSRRSLWAKSGRTLDPSNPLRNWHPINSRQFSHLLYSRRQCTKPGGGTTSPTSASSADQFKSRLARNSFPHNASSSSSTSARPVPPIPRSPKQNSIVFTIVPNICVHPCLSVANFHPTAPLPQVLRSTCHPRTPALQCHPVHRGGWRRLGRQSVSNPRPSR